MQTWSTVLYTEKIEEFWREFEVILSTDGVYTAELLHYRDIMNSVEINFVGYQVPGGNDINLVLYLMKEKTKYSIYRAKFALFLEENSSWYNEIYTKWKALVSI